MREEVKTTIYPFIGTMITFWISYALIYNILTNIERISFMDQWVSSVIAGVSAAAISAAVTLYVNRKSQMTKNTEALNKLIERLGVTDEETLTHKISGQYDQIRLDIGRETRGNGSLTNQHDNITKEINRDFNVIHARFEKTDAEYRKFTSEQHDIAKSVENFVIDYRKMASDGSDYRQKIYELERVIEERDIKIQSLEKTLGEKELNIQSLNSYIDELENKLNPPEHDGISF